MWSCLASSHTAVFTEARCTTVCHMAAVSQCRATDTALLVSFSAVAVHSSTQATGAAMLTDIADGMEDDDLEQVLEGVEASSTLEQLDHAKGQPRT